MKKYKVGDVVRLYKYPKNNINAYVVIMDITEDGRVWISNWDMLSKATGTFQGGINLICSKEQFEEKISYKKKNNS